MGIFEPFYKLTVYLKSLLFSSRIQSEFCKDIEDEYYRIEKYLPQHAESVLDVGCGVAGIDVFVSNHYKNGVDVCLIDKTHVDKSIHYDFHNSGSFYSSLDIARSVLEMNGTPKEKVHVQEATPDSDVLFSRRFDVVISLISWGFHYPVATYLDAVYGKLNDNGVLIIDIRKDTDGEKEIARKFGNCEVIFEAQKYIKVLAKKCQS